MKRKRRYARPHPGRGGVQITEFVRGQVATLAEGGVTQRSIAARLKMALETLRKHFPDELKAGSDIATAEIIGGLYGIATGKVKASGRDRLLAMMFWLKCRAGWKDRHILEHTGEDGGPIEVIETVIVDPKAKGSR